MNTLNVIKIMSNKYKIMKRKLYILKLQSDKYYIGTTTKPIDERVKEHILKHGSTWTKLYTPVNIEYTKENIDEYDEDKYTKIYMNKYGIDNVRGGSYVSISLPEYQMQALQQELRLSNNEFFKCGKKDHYANECTQSISLSKSSGWHINIISSCYRRRIWSSSNNNRPMQNRWNNVRRSSCYISNIIIFRIN